MTMIAKKNIKLKLDQSDLGYYDAEDVDKDGLFFITDFNGGCHGVYSCREELRQDAHSDDNFIGFICPALDIGKLHKFFNCIENALILPKSQALTFFYTNRSDAVVIKLSDFWLKDVIKRDLFSLFLRCGAVYYNNSFNNALDSYKLTKQCRPALEWFLAGNTEPNFSLSPLLQSSFHLDNMIEDFENDFIGFVDTFRKFDKTQLRQSLIKAKK